MKWFYNMKIGAKLILGFAIVAIIAGVVGFVGIVNLNNINKNYTDLYNNYGIPLGDIADVSNYYQLIRVDLRDLILEEDDSKKEEVVKSMDDNEKLMQESLQNFKASLQTKEGQDAYTKLEEALAEYKPVQQEIIKYALADQSDQALATLNLDSSAVIVKEIMNEINILFKLKDDNGIILSEQYASNARITITTVIVIVIIAIIVALALGIFISRMISKPIIRMVGIAEKVADGDLNVEIKYNSKDEIGVLAQAFRKMTDNLNEVMSNISTAAEQVSAGSTQLSDSSMALSQGATEQASSIEELSASLEEISSQTKLNAENAKKANDITESAKDSAIEGNNQMSDMLKAMEDINDASINISKIIKVIDDIAFQTNILALNAAVEAARAGQHGKGFAVVAEEVRNLAARSANAAKETTSMIEGSVKKAEGGTKIANETATALNKIVESIASAASLISSIADASNEQAQGISQINQGIMQVSTVVQTNSSTSEESAAASEELASQAMLLEEQVAKFKLKKLKRNTTYKEYEDNDSAVNQAADKRNKESNHDRDKNTKKILLSDHEFGKY